jgi:DNA-binding NarL/FixJ family response regulator
MDTDIQVVIADDHPVFRKGLRQIIELESGLKILGEANDGMEALRLIREMKPDVAVLDVKMPQMKGFEVARELQQDKQAVGIVFLTMYDDESMFNEALNVGARGYLLKDSATSDIVNCIRVVAAGQHYISPSISNYLVNRDTRRKVLNSETPGLNDLTPTELRVLKLIAQRKTSKAIAEQLFISYSTVENHRHSICQKLDIHTKNGLMMFAVEHRSELA